MAFPEIPLTSARAAESMTSRAAWQLPRLDEGPRP